MKYMLNTVLSPLYWTHSNPPNAIRFTEWAVFTCTSWSSVPIQNTLYQQGYILVSFSVVLFLTPGTNFFLWSVTEQGISKQEGKVAAFLRLPCILQPLLCQPRNVRVHVSDWVLYVEVVFASCCLFFYSVIVIPFSYGSVVCTTILESESWRVHYWIWSARLTSDGYSISMDLWYKCDEKWAKTKMNSSLTLQRYSYINLPVSRKINTLCYRSGCSYWSVKTISGKFHWMTIHENFVLKIWCYMAASIIT